MSNCPKCGQPLNEGAKFCGECGAAVRHCSTCGAELKEGAAYCGQCGAEVNDEPPDSGKAVSPVTSHTDPVAAQGATTLARVRFTLFKPFFAKLGEFLPIWFTNTILLDGYELRTMEMGETVELEVPVGQHTIQLVHAYRSIATVGLTISRNSNRLELIISVDTLTAVVGVYNNLWQKFDLSVQGYFPLR